MKTEKIYKILDIIGISILIMLTFFFIFGYAKNIYATIINQQTDDTGQIQFVNVGSNHGTITIANNITDPVLTTYAWSNQTGGNGSYISIGACYWELMRNSYSQGNFPRSKPSLPETLHPNDPTCTITAGTHDIGLSGGNTGTYYYISADSTNTTPYYILENIDTIGITSTAPANNATGVNAYTNFTGTYDNDGTYDTILIGLDNLDQPSVPLTIIVCDTAETGTNLNYSCFYSGSTNTHYQFNVQLWDSTQTYPAGTISDTEGAYVYTTGNVYEVNTPSTSSTCSGFDVGCYLENALSWFFGINQSTLNQFSNLTLKNSLPFSYLYDMGNLYNELFDNNPEDIDITIEFSSFGNITLLSTDKLNAVPFHGVVRTILGAIMIFMATMFIYRKVLGVHDNQAQIATKI